MNPASRLIPIIDIALSRGGHENKATRGWWDTALRTENDSGVINDSQLSYRLVSLCSQIDILQDLLAAQGVPEGLHKPHLGKIKDGLSPARLNDSWNGTKQYFSADALTTLRWAEWAAQEVESEVSADEINSLLSQINSLEESIQADGIPPSLKRILQNQVNELRSSLAMYPICGIEPLKKAAKAAMAEAMIEKTELSDAANDKGSFAAKAVQKFATTLSKTIDVVNRAATAGRSTATLISFTNSGIKFLEDSFK